MRIFLIALWQRGSFKLAIRSLAALFVLYPFIAANLAVSQIQSYDADAPPWERLADGRIVVEVKGVRLALPSDESDISEYYFSKVPLDTRSWRSLEQIIDDPGGARKWFSELPSILVRKGYSDDFSRSRSTTLQKSTIKHLNGGIYTFAIGEFPRRRCASDFAGWVFYYGNIAAPQGQHPFDRTNYLACAGENVSVTYGSLYRVDWTDETVPDIQENLTKLFNSVLQNRQVRTYDHDLRDK